MQYFRQLNNGDERYIFRDRNCIGRHCWSPGIVQSGRMQTACCVINAADGCPVTTAPVDAKLINERRAQGWVTA